MLVPRYLFAPLLLLALTASAQPVRPPELTMQLNRATAAYRSGGSMVEAKVRVDRVLADRPQDAEALKLRARIHLRMGRSAEALADAQQAALQRPYDGEAHLLVSEAAVAEGDAGLAHAALRRAAQYNLEDATYHVRLSACAAALGELQAAEAYARIALRNAPEEPAAYYQLARVFMRQERPEAAAEVVLQGLRAAVLPAGAVERDSLLRELLERPDVQRELRR